MATPQPASQSANGEAPSKSHPNDVGWQFVPQYYKYVNKHPDRLHCFYNKKSTFIHGDEGDDGTPCFGQHEIHEKITSLGYSDCKVYINSIDSQSSAGGGIIILVIGEMANAGGSWRKFTQTFFLAEQPNGYFVLNDIFRYLREADDDEEEETSAAEPAAAPEPEVEEAVSSYTAKDTAAEVVEPAAPAPVEDVVIQPEAKVDEPENVLAAEEVTTSADPAVEEPIPVPSVVPPPAPEAEATAPAAIPAAAPVTVPDQSAPAPAPASAPVPAPAPSAPSKPAAKAAPKSWASLAAGGGSSPWNRAAAAPAPAPVAAAAAAPAPAPVPAAAPAAAPASAPSAPSTGSAAVAPRAQGGRHPALDAVAAVQTPHCFVKLPNWSISSEQQINDPIDETTLRTAVTRFGEVVKVEIVKAKACAFVEFAKVESARKAIIASLPQSQGGEGGVKVGEGRQINLETRKEKEDRAKGQKRPQGQQQQSQQQQPRQQANGARGGRSSGAGRGGRPAGDKPKA